MYIKKHKFISFLLLIYGYYLDGIRWLMARISYPALVLVLVGGSIISPCPGRVSLTYKLSAHPYTATVLNKGRALRQVIKDHYQDQVAVMELLPSFRTVSKRTWSKVLEVSYDFLWDNLQLDSGLRQFMLSKGIMTEKVYKMLTDVPFDSLRERRRNLIRYINKRPAQHVYLIMTFLARKRDQRHILEELYRNYCNLTGRAHGYPPAAPAVRRPTQGQEERGTADETPRSGSRASGTTDTIVSGLIPLSRIARIAPFGLSGSQGAQGPMIDTRLFNITDEKIPDNEQQDPDVSVEGKCVVCLCNKIKVIFLNCGHSTLCKQCAISLLTDPDNKCITTKAVTCPVCRANVTRVQPIYRD